MPPLPALRHASLGAFLALLLCSPVRADLDIQGPQRLLQRQLLTAPFPRGWCWAGAVIGGQARYQHQDDPDAHPGGLILCDNLMYLGDRARYYLSRNGNLSTYAFGRMRFGNLDPDDDPFLHGMEKRRAVRGRGWGRSSSLPTPSGACGPPRDVTGTSNGRELMLWANFPSSAVPCC